MKRTLISILFILQIQFVLRKKKHNTSSVNIKSVEGKTINTESLKPR